MDEHRGRSEEAGAEAPPEVEVVVLVDEIVDIEECARAGRRPHPHAKAYVIRVDGHKITVHKARITGREILSDAGKRPPEKYILRQVLSGGSLEKIELDQVVDLTRQGIEKFKTMLKTAQDGRS